MFPQRQFENSESVHKKAQSEIADRYYCTIEGDLVGRIGMVTLATIQLVIGVAPVGVFPFYSRSKSGGKSNGKWPASGVIRC